jgi:hypothetical protein
MSRYRPMLVIKIFKIHASGEWRLVAVCPLLKQDTWKGGWDRYVRSKLSTDWESRFRFPVSMEKFLACSGPYPTHCSEPLLTGDKAADNSIYWWLRVYRALSFLSLYFPKLVVCSNDAVYNSVHECMASNDRMILNDEGEMMLTEAVVAQFKVMCHTDPLLGNDLVTSNEYSRCYCNRRINKWPFLSNGSVNTFLRIRYPGCR